MTDNDKALTLPARPELVTPDVVTAYYVWFEGMAEDNLHRQELAGTVEFDGPNEREMQKCRLMLGYAESMGLVADGVRDQILTRIARKQLYRYAPEGWMDLRELIHDALPSISSSGARSELAAIADDIAPFAEAHDIDVFENPGKMGYLREAASALRSIVKGPGSVTERADKLRGELDFIFNEATSAQGPEDTSVRSRYRQCQATPATGAVGEIDGQAVLMIVGPPETVAAIRQRASRLVDSNWRSVTVERDEETRPSKIEGDLLVTRSTRVILAEMRVVNKKTGEIEEVFT